MKQSNLHLIFKALSSEQRLKIFMMIYKQCHAQGKAEFKAEESSSCCPGRRVFEKAFTKVCACMSLSRSTISHHFKELQNAGLISCERIGQTFRCRVNEEAVNSIKEFLG